MAVTQWWDDGTARSLGDSWSRSYRLGAGYIQYLTVIALQQAGGFNQL